MSRVIVHSCVEARPDVVLDESDGEDDDNAQDIEETSSVGHVSHACHEEECTKEEALDQYGRRRRHAKRRGIVDNFKENASADVLASIVDRSPSLLPEKAGWVQKAGSGWFSRWHSRYLQVQNKCLYWYASPDEKVPRGAIDFDLVEVEVERLWRDSASSEVDTSRSGRRACGWCSTGNGGIIDNSDQSGPVRFRICPVGLNRGIEISVDDIEEARTWISSIAAHIRAADERSFPRCPVLQGSWWKVRRISPEGFLHLADTGDVVLFRSSGAFPRIIRAAHGGSRYDHVALVLRLADGELGLLEATGENGVDICPWEKFLAHDWQTLYPEMALRRVRFARTGERLQAMQEWCREVMGKPYGLTLRKLASRSSVSLGGKDLTSDFFCSQLVAEGLKVLGVLPRGRSSTLYWPSSFSSRMAPLDCKEGCSFDSADLVIDFSSFRSSSAPT